MQENQFKLLELFYHEKQLTVFQASDKRGDILSGFFTTDHDVHKAIFALRDLGFLGRRNTGGNDIYEINSVGINTYLRELNLRNKDEYQKELNLKLLATTIDANTSQIKTNGNIRISNNWIKIASISSAVFALVILIVTLIDRNSEVDVNLKTIHQSEQQYKQLNKKLDSLTYQINRFEKRLDSTLYEESSLSKDNENKK